MTKSTDTQAALVRKHLLDHGSITAKQAIAAYQCYRLAARVYELREGGMRIGTEKTRNGNGGWHAKYVMKLIGWGDKSGKQRQSTIPTGRVGDG